MSIDADAEMAGRKHKRPAPKRQASTQQMAGAADV
jgi:hypothetical protein